MANSINIQIVLFAILGGFLPALLWLWFWLKEDKRRPEPTGLIALTFFSGMLAVPLAIFFEELTINVFPLLSSSLPIKVIVWASIEEILKFGMVALGAFETPYFDEPIDAVIYMITAALGFAALENTFFLMGVFQSHGFFDWFTTGNSRFIGATVLHAVSSSLVGAAIGYTFYKSKWIRALALLVGLILASSLHAAFNFFIIENEGKSIMGVFFILWMIAILAIIIFEKVRKTKPALKKMFNK